jgi:hypothetical protein
MSPIKIVKPPYVDPAGNTGQGQLPVRPPFEFTGVTSRVFPLKANMARLTQFVDAYVNMDIPPEIAHFKPALPYVYMMVLDYGSMSSASMQAQNVGWVSQHEVTFTVPLQRWCKEGGQLVFKDWAAVSPFIFVDDEVSLTTGREVYGWPKMAGRVDAVTPMWEHHPLEGERLFAFSASVFPKVYAGESEEQRVLLQIDSDPRLRLSEFPPDPGNAWAPWVVWQQAATSSLQLMGQAADMVLALRSRGYRTSRNPASLKAMAGRGLDYALRLGPELLRKQVTASANRLLGTGFIGGQAAAPGGSAVAFDNITVKQFRDAQEPERACYKALIRSRMGIERFNGGGLLGDAGLLRGDPSGGYTIRVHRYEAMPIIQSLGIEVAKDDHHADGTHVSLLKPVFPFWSDVDLYYGAGEPICSRLYAQGVEGLENWIQEEATANVDTGQSASDPGMTGDAPVSAFGYASATLGEQVAARPASGDYNNALGAATMPVVGPFHFPDLTQHVYPLLADRKQLEAFVTHNLNLPLAGSGLRFETVGAYAYLMVNVIGNQNGTMWSSANDIGWWAEREVSFCVPVKWFRTNAQGHEELISIALVSPFVYASNGRAVATDREVMGRATWRAQIDSPEDVWLDPSGPNRPRSYLEMSTEVFPALGYGQKAEQRTLLQVDAGDVLPYNDNVGWRMVGERFGVHLIEELMRKTALREERAEALAQARAMALEVLAHGQPINFLTLKQYRDAGDVSQACYQALVHTRRCIDRVYDLREIENRVHVRVHRFPGHPIVQSLGLQIKSTDSSGGHVVDNLQPQRPFWMRASVREELSSTVAVRRPDGSWHLPHPWLDEGARRNDSGDDARNHGAPYFQAPGLTRVAAPWPEQPQRLRAHQSKLLHDALRDSLTQAQKALLAMDAAARDELRSRLLPAHGQAMLALLAARDVAAFVEGQQADPALKLEAALLNAGLVFEPPQGPVQRFSHEQARAAILALDEVQLVLEAVLGEEWENWGNPRWFRGLPAKPEPCIPVGSLQGGLEALQACTPGTAAAERLTATEDGWVYLRPQ